MEEEELLKTKGTYWHIEAIPPDKLKRTGQPYKLFLYEGKELNILQLAEKARLKPSTIFYRLKNGYSLEQAFTTPLQKYCNYFYAGKYRTIGDIAKMCKVTKSSLKYWLHKGFNIEEAIRKVRKCQ